MIIQDEMGKYLFIEDDNSILQQLPHAIKIGTVRIDSVTEKRATIIAAPTFKDLVELEHLLTFQISAVQIGQALKNIGFTVVHQLSG